MNAKSDRLLFGTSLFVLGLSLGLILSWSGSGISGVGVPAVFGQAGRGISTGGIMAFTGQIAKDTYGIVMVDVDAGTLWLYQFQKPGNQLKLLAARSWLYDRYLEDYNCASPSPSEISQLIANIQQKKQQKQSLETLDSGSPK